MAKIDKATGGTTALPAQQHGKFAVLEKVVDLSVTALPSTDVMAIFNLPAGVLPLGLGWKVTTADSVLAGTIDVGLYKSSDSAVVDVDGLKNELPIGEAGSGYAAPAAANEITEAMFVGLAHGAGGAGATFNDAVIEFALAVVDLTAPASAE